MINIPIDTFNLTTGITTNSKLSRVTGLVKIEGSLGLKIVTNRTTRTTKMTMRRMPVTAAKIFKPLREPAMVKEFRLMSSLIWMDEIKTCFYVCYKSLFHMVMVLLSYMPVVVIKTRKEGIIVFCLSCMFFY